MNWSTSNRVSLPTFFLGVVGTAALLFLVGCRHIQDENSLPLAGGASAIEDVPDIVTADIQAGIENHIAEQVKLGNGHFRVAFEDKELQLELVRVHTEYLATLGPNRQFACVDMVSTDGTFYDVDFFMEGPRGAMKVTETTVHKINGRPFYIWAQGKDKAWGRVAVEKATNELLGIISGRDKFRFSYQMHVPVVEKEARVWIPLAQSDQFQTVDVVSVSAPVAYETLVDTAYGNKVLFFVLGPQASGEKIVVTYDVDRREKGAYASDPVEAQRYLGPHLKVQTDGYIKVKAEMIVAGKQGDLMRARAIYDHVVDSMSYKRCGIGWGKGDVSHSAMALSGNCTDFHSYFMALARAVGIPARFAIGASIPSDRDEGGVDGYHCWAEFYAEGKWWPVDISEANKFTSLSMYYFGHHPANRFEFSHGRDLVLDPGPKSGPVNFLAYPVMEIDGEPQSAKILFGFERKP